jgi:ribosomal protein L30E
MGFDVALEAIVGGSARHVLVASNVSPKTLKEVHYRLQSEGLDGKVKVLTLPLTIQEVGSYINVSAGVIAVCDGGFGKAFERLLQ